MHCLVNHSAWRIGNVLSTTVQDSLNEIEGELEASVKNIEDAVMTFFQSWNTINTILASIDKRANGITN